MQYSTRGTILILISAVFFSLNTIMVKMISVYISSFNISMIRFVTGVAAGLFFLYISGKKFKVVGWKIWLFRGILGSFAMILYFKTIELNGIGWATLLVNMAAFFAAVNGRIFFRKNITVFTVIGMVVAFSGILVIYYNNPSISLIGTLCGLGVAFIRGFTTHIIKISSKDNHPVTVYLAACMIGILYFPFRAGEIPQIPLYAALFAILAGLVVFFAQVLMTSGLRHVSAVRNTLLLYTTIPISLFLGFLIGEEFSFRFLIGTILIIIGILVELLNKAGENLGFMASVNILRNRIPRK